MMVVSPLLLLLLICNLASCFDLCIQNLPNRSHKDLYADPNDCHYFYHCFYYNSTVANAVRRKCADGLFWHDQVLSCLPEGKVPCQDRCLDGATQAKGAFAGEGCRQFFQCANTASYAMCCPESSSFHEPTGICNYDPNCHDPCTMQAPLVATTVAPSKQLNATTCLDSFGSMISVVSDEDNAYILLDQDGNPTEKMYCAETTSFHLATCRCNIETSNAVFPIQQPTRNPIMWAKFDGNTKDSSMSDFALFLHEGAKIDVLTHALGNSSLRLDGGYVSVPGMKTFDLGKSASFCAFFKCQDGTCSKKGGILSNYKSQEEFTVVMGVQTGNMFVGKLNIWHPVGNQSVSGKIEVPPNGWNHACLTYDGNAMRLFLNGALADTQFVGGFLSISALEYQIGRDALLGSFDGNIDDVYVATFAMTEAEVIAHQKGTDQANVTSSASNPVIVGKLGTWMRYSWGYLNTGCDWRAAAFRTFSSSSYQLCADECGASAKCTAWSYTPSHKCNLKKGVLTTSNAVKSTNDCGVMIK